MERTSAMAHERTSAMAHERTSAMAHAVPKGLSLERTTAIPLVRLPRLAQGESVLVLAMTSRPAVSLTAHERMSAISSRTPSWAQTNDHLH
jgi:hypothetical protein